MKKLILLALLSVQAAAAEPDVIVYGSTPGGFCAAIAAAREGASVVLLEPTDHIGGVNTGGLSFSDSNQTLRSTVMGLFDEWHSRIEADYVKRGITLPYQVSVKDHSYWTYEPSVAMRITLAMLDEAKVKVLTKRVLKSVDKDGARITKLHTSDGDFTAKTYVDASYEGDLMAAAGVSWTIGREGRAEFGESLAGKRYPKPLMPISGRDADGKLLPFITTGDAGPEAEGDKNVMIYSFRLCVTKDPANRVPFPAPASYDPAKFEVMRRFCATGKAVPMWDLYPLPGGKFDANNGIHKQFSMGLIGACNGWSEADEAGRAKIWEAHKQYTLELYHFYTTDPSVPERLRKEHAKYGLCRDEFAAYGHFSPQLYVREGRRMKGPYVVSQNDIQKEPQKDDAIAISSFPIDSHDCQRVAKTEGVINEGTIIPVLEKGRKHGPAFHIPYRSITPAASECDNLLVPVALSCTHVGISSIRVEPTWMIIGQSAGIAAALSAKQNVAVQKLPYPTLREHLLKQKQVLEIPVLPPIKPEPQGAKGIDPKTLQGIILDDTDARLEGQWKHSSSFKPYINTGYVHSEQPSDGQTTATFRLTVPKTGNYDLGLAYSAHETRAKNLPIILESGGEKTTLIFDQTLPLPSGKSFRSAGVVKLSAEGETKIILSNQGTEGFVILDALQLLPVDE
jgi:FAD dependent oxidoreductase